MSAPQDAQPDAGWIENRPTRGWRGIDPRELWRYRELAWFLAWRDVKVRYKQAAFGVAWAALQPLAGMIVFTIVFRRLADMPSDDIPYPVFSFLGLALWTYFSSSVTKATEILVDNAALVTKVYFPRLAAPAAAVLPALFDLAIAFALLGVLMAIFGVAPTWSILALPALVLALILAALGVGLCLATLNVQYRDFRHGVTLMLSLWLFISPIAYPASAVADGWRHVYALNPVAGIVEGFRWALIGGPWPGVDLAISLTVAFVLLIVGLLYFQRSERRFADVI